MTMSCRFELFVADLDTSIRFYTDVLGFEVRQRDAAYAYAVRGDVRIGFGLRSTLPARGDGLGFTQERVAAGRGAGVEIVLEVDDLRQQHDRVVDAGCALVEPLQRRPWGLSDFRIVDPDGFYLRITHR